MKKQVTALLCLSLLVLPACNAGSEATSSSEPALTSEAAPQAMPIEYSDSGYAEAPVQADADMYAMDTVMHFRVYGRDKAQASKAIEDAFAEIKRLDALMSTNQKQSELAILNRTGTTTLSKDNAYLLKRAMEINAQTDGNFNIAVYPLVKAWGFTTQKYNVPSEETITKLLPLTEVKDVHFDEKSGKVSLAKKNMGLDFGGIAKGYASQRLMDIFKEDGIPGGLVTLGGNTQLYRSKPDGSDFAVGVQNPQDVEDYVGVIRGSDEAIITSGTYQRFFERDGKKYHHIIDPATGAPADNTLSSATVVCQDGTTADALATALMIMGRDEAIAFWQKNADRFEMVLIDKDNKVTITPGLQDRYTPKDRPAPEVLAHGA